MVGHICIIMLSKNKIKDSSEAGIMYYMFTLGGGGHTTAQLYVTINCKYSNNVTCMCTVINTLTLKINSDSNISVTIE